VIAFLMEVLFSFYVAGWRATPSSLHDPNLLAGVVTGTIGLLGIIGALVGILAVTHEYRYNTIMYTLTAAKNRTQVFVAKFIAVSCFAIAFSFVFGLLSPLLTSLAIQLHGQTLIQQDIAIWDLLWRALFVGWGFMAFAFIMAMLIRSQVGAIAALFIIPSTVEQLLGLILKNNQFYLPFISLSQVLEHQYKTIGRSGGADAMTPFMSYGKAALVVGIYVAVGGLIAWILFRRRDAN